MNQPFIVITLGSFVMNDDVTSSLESFRLFRDGLTKKHFNRIQLVVIEKPVFLDALRDRIDQYKLNSQVKVIDVENQNEVTQAYKNASIILLPTQRNIKKIIPEALSFGLPILTYKEQNESKIIDNSCGMLIESWNIGNSIIQYADVLNMLYFDPNVTAILKRGAKAKYQKEFKFSRRR